MVVEGVVGRVVKLPPREGHSDERGLTTVSIEGLSLLVREGNPVPAEGQPVRAVVTTSWPKGGGRPRHWLGHWVASF